MPSQRSSQRRAQGGGRTPNSEPKLQVFRDFSGIDFQNATLQPMPSGGGTVIVDSPRTDGDQTDLQMNFMYLQNNVSVASNKTLETRDNIMKLFSAPDDVTFSGPVKLVGNHLYAATTAGDIAVGNIDDAFESIHTDDQVLEIDDTVELDNNTGSDHEWTDFDYYDDKLIGLTRQNEIWISDVNRSTFEAGVMANSAGIEDPLLADISADGIGMSTSDTFTQECPYRVAIAYAYVNQFGPTKMSSNKVIYTSVPVSEWHLQCFLSIASNHRPPDGSTAVELYYTTENAGEMIFLDRVEITPIMNAWVYYWYGYVDATDMWAVGNLTPPTENYTKGAPASRVTNIDGRLYFWGDNDQPQRLYIGGNPGNLLSISPGTGGGFVDVEPGTGQGVRYVCKYKTQSGNSIVTMLCDSPNSRKEQRFNLVENTISIANEQSMNSWQAEQVAGAVGCKSYNGAVVCQDGIYSVSRYGLALTTMTMEYNSQIRTTYVSDPIKPVFTDAAMKDVQLSNASLLECDGVIYMVFGEDVGYGGLSNIIFCYDIDLKAWWTHSLETIPSTIRGIFHMDWEGQREGIGIVTDDGIYLLPTTVADGDDEKADHTFLIQSAQLSTQMPKQGWQYLSQLEFHFDYLIGDITIELRAIDMFGRKIKVTKQISEDEEIDDFTAYMRVDQRLMSYVLTMTGTARFRMTHFIARVYTMSNKIGQVWGFDDRISNRNAWGDIHPTFKCYNDVRRAIFT